MSDGNLEKFDINILKVIVAILQNSGILKDFNLTDDIIKTWQTGEIPKELPIVAWFLKYGSLQFKPNEKINNTFTDLNTKSFLSNMNSTFRQLKEQTKDFPVMVNLLTETEKLFCSDVCNGIYFFQAIEKSVNEIKNIQVGQHFKFVKLDLKLLSVPSNGVFPTVTIKFEAELSFLEKSTQEILIELIDYGKSKFPEHFVDE